MRIRHIFGILFLFLALVVAISPGAKSQDSVFPAGLPQGSITNLNGAMSGITGQTTITLTKPATKIQIYSSSGASNIFADFNNVAAATGVGNTTEIFGGGSETYVGAPIYQFKVISDGSTGTYCVVAN